MRQRVVTLLIALMVFSKLCSERGFGAIRGTVALTCHCESGLYGQPILMLDECTSSLDAKTRRKLSHYLYIMTDRTVLPMTHGPAAIKIDYRTVEL